VADVDLDTRRAIRCKAGTAGSGDCPTGPRCTRRAQWEGLCFQHWRMERKGKPVVRVARI
jgi:hypothetical protein